MLGSRLGCHTPQCLMVNPLHLCRSVSLLMSYQYVGSWKDFLFVCTHNLAGDFVHTIEFTFLRSASLEGIPLADVLSKIINATYRVALCLQQQAGVEHSLAGGERPIWRKLWSLNVSKNFRLESMLEYTTYKRQLE